MPPWVVISFLGDSPGQFISLLAGLPAVREVDLSVASLVAG